MIVTWRRCAHARAVSRVLAHPCVADLVRAAALLDVPDAAAGAILERLEAAGASLELTDLYAIERAVALAAQARTHYSAAVKLARALEHEDVLPLVETVVPGGHGSPGGPDLSAPAPALERERPSAGGGS